MPFELVADDEVIALVYDVNKLDNKVLAISHDVNIVKPESKANHDVNKLTELPLSKKRQAAGRLAQL